METILTRLQQLFAVRQAASSKKRHSNTALREEAVKCLEHYTHGEVSKAIGMSVATLRSWQKSLRGREQTAIDNPPAFVAVNLRPQKDMDEASHALFLRISLPGGIVIQVDSNSPRSSAALIMALNEESNPCSI